MVSVDAADYVVWRNEINTPAAYNTWRANFGRTAASGAVATSTSVPEPASVVLIIVAACTLVMLPGEVCSWCEWNRRNMMRVQIKIDWDISRHVFVYHFTLL